ncbi:AMP-binding protein [Rhodococcus sp. X156]|uniref:AMP-binding protein n=1 Tax=Rhodococcus sp. X156 TaxID=2499145 RepID=UPI000FDB529C|nr:AMP-binding protein [Rhodococcus sp. X156]
MTETPATFADVLLRRADDEHDGLLFEDSRWSWRELVQECADRSAVLQELRRPERAFHVGVLLENVPEFLFLIGAGALSGATVVGINSTRRGEELAADIRGVDCDLVVTDAHGAALLAGLDLGLPSERVLECDGADWQARLERHRGAPLEPTAEARDPRTLLMLLFTSGSTGNPKAVICSTGRMAMLASANVMHITRDDVSYNAMPMFHGNAIMACFAPAALVGGTFVLRRKFSASGFLPDVLRYGVTFFNYVGRSLAYLLHQPENPDEKRTRLRAAFGTEAAPLDRAEFERRFGVAPTESYGSSEGAVVISHGPDAPPGSLGTPPAVMPVQIQDPDGNECPPAEFDVDGKLLNSAECIGEIVNTQGAMMFEGYYKNPEATAARIDGTAYRSGDLGYRDKGGFFYFAGRAGDWMRVDSENFASAPIERVLARFPGVLLVAVYPVPDSRTGDRVMATLSMADGEQFSPAAFYQFLTEQPDMGTKWAPTYVRLVEDVPVTATRKIDKMRLRRESWLVDDPIYVREEDCYALLREDKRAEILAEYAMFDRPTAAL